MGNKEGRSSVEGAEIEGTGDWGLLQAGGRGDGLKDRIKIHYIKRLKQRGRREVEY